MSTEIIEPAAYKHAASFNGRTTMCGIAADPKNVYPVIAKHLLNVTCPTCFTVYRRRCFLVLYAE